MARQEVERVSYYDAMGHGRTDYASFYGQSSPRNFGRLHCHDFYEFYIHYQGGDYLGINAETYRLKPNQLIIIPPFCIHSPMGVKDWTNYERAYLYTSPETLRTLGCGQIDLEALLNQRIEQGCRQFLMTEEDAGECKRLLSEMSQHLYNPTPMQRFEDYASMLAFLRIVCRLVTRATAQSKPIVLNEMMHDVLTYINERFTQPLSLDELAQRFSVSKSYLSHAFSRYVNRSVYEYILYRRVMLAKQLIRTGTPFNTAAYQCGFSDYSNFLRVFHKLVGMAPSAYRRQASGQA